MRTSICSSLIDDVEDRLGENRDEWEWGNLKHALFEHALSPAVDEESAETLNVGPKPMGGENYTAGRAGHNDEFQLTHGGSWRMVIDVGGWNNSLAMNVLGQSGDPESPFYDNLLEMFVNGEYFSLLYTREAIQDACVRRVDPQPASSKQISIDFLFWSLLVSASECHFRITRRHLVQSKMRKAPLDATWLASRHPPFLTGTPPAESDLDHRYTSRN